MNKVSEGVSAPSLEIRGVVEGFYGPVWTAAERRMVMSLMADVAMNTYVYGPKEDPFHRKRWREFYPDLTALRDAVLAADEFGLQFVYALHPKGINETADDEAQMTAKIAQLKGIGVTHFAIFFDDIDELTAEGGTRHGELSHQFAAAALAPGSRLLVCPTDYAGTESSAYRTALAASAPDNALFCWTGRDIVVGSVTDDEAVAARKALGRDLVLWDNFPVNDFESTRAFLGPIVDRPRDPNSLVGILANPMVQAVPSLIALATVGEYARDPGDYESLVAWRRAIDKVASLTEVDAADLEIVAQAHGEWPPSAPPGRPLHPGAALPTTGEVAHAVARIAKSPPWAPHRELLANDKRLSTDHHDGFDWAADQVKQEGELP